MDRRGSLVDDLAIETGPGMLIERSLPRRASASHAIGDTLAERAAETYGL